MRGFLRVLAAVVVAAGILAGSAGLSFADDSKPVAPNPATIPEVKKPAIAAAIREQVASDYCGTEGGALSQDAKVDPNSDKYRTCHEKLLSILPTGFDAIYPYTTVKAYDTACMAGQLLDETNQPDTGYDSAWCNTAGTNKDLTKNDQAWRGFWSKIIGDGGLGVVDFVANPKDSTEKLANELKTDSNSALAAVIDNASRATDFDPNADWFRTQWAAFGGIGIIVLAFMTMRTVRDYGDGKITAEETTHAIVGFGPLGLLLVLFGPALGHFLNTQIAALDVGVIKFTSGSFLSFADATDFNGFASGGVFGPVAGIILWGLMLLGAWSILVLFVLQSIALGMIGAALAIGLGFVVHPLWRKRAVKMGTTYLGIALSKPLLFLILGFVMAMIGGQAAVVGGDKDPLTNALKVLTVGLVMLTVGFAPATLFKYMPLLPGGGDSIQRHGSGMGRAAVGGAAGALMSSRMFRNSSRTAGGRQGAGSSGGTGSGRSGGSTGTGTAGGTTTGVQNAAGGGTGKSGGASTRGAGNTGKGQSQSQGQEKRGQSAARQVAGKAGTAVAGTSKVAAGVALKAALAAANTAASSARSQAQDHAPSFD
ncbi:hypothetical protein [Arthrobacter sp. GAS37]|uniref:hypothetical protein n=1 Tax=Arthrobacter sp. GAS37 TaxID=3156261 RepID=UPI00384E26D1